MLGSLVCEIVELGSWAVCLPGEGSFMFFLLTYKVELA